VLAVPRQNASGGFLVYELVIPGRIIIYPVEGKCWQSEDDKILRMVTSQEFLTMKNLYCIRNIFSNLKIENVIKIKK
jgi:hypothetical protein